MSDVFFTATQKALDNITSLFDTVWPTAVGLWNLRCSVNGVKSQFPTITETQLAAKFTLGSGIHGINFKRAFTEKTWEQQQVDFAWTILNSAFPIYEGWLEEMKLTVFPNMDIKIMQFPVKVKNQVSLLTSNRSLVLTNTLYPSYSTRRNRCYNKIDPLMKCLRVFKEARNCYMHNGSVADPKLLAAYSDYIPHATTSALCVTEVPEFPAPVLNSSVQLSLRGVVGFSDILRKILISLDTELLCAVEAENEFISRYQNKQKLVHKLKADPNKARRQVKQYVTQCGFPTPKAIDDMTAFLLSHHLITR